MISTRSIVDGGEKERAEMRPDPPALPVILLTTAFPYGQREVFLETEVRYLARAPLEVCVVPLMTPGRARPVPAGVIVDESLTPRVGGTARRLLRAAGSPRNALLEIKEAAHGWPARGWPRALHRLAIHLDLAALTARRLDRALRARGWERRPFIVYSYWFTGVVFGAIRLKPKYPGMKVVARAHGSDLYAEVYDPPYMPLRRRTLAGIDRVFVVSEHGRSYLLNHACAPEEKVVVARLGVDDPDSLAAGSTDGVIRVVSCSSCRPVKRLGLLVHSLKACAEQQLRTVFSWTHFGDGPLRPQIERLATETLPPNVSFRFPGRVENRAVLDHYRDNPVDVFVNVSESEGVPVSIMEAQSFGIPVVAPAVGGVPEIMSDTIGSLLDADPTPDDVAQAVWREAHRPMKERAQIQQLWRRKFSAEKNYGDFVRLLWRLGSADA
jgi:colanic acid/amylovoran biosynthesis glycosyltransferase